MCVVNQASVSRTVAEVVTKPKPGAVAASSIFKPEVVEVRFLTWLTRLAFNPCSQTYFIIIVKQTY